MMRALLASLVLLVAQASGHGAAPRHLQEMEGIEDYIAFLEGLWNSCDKDGSDCLSLVEFRDAAAKLGLDESEFTQHQGNLTTLFYDLDSGSNSNITNCLTKHEILDAVDRFADYAPIFVHAFTNGAGVVPTSVPTVPTAVLNLEAPVVVEVMMKLAVLASDIYPGQRDMIIQFLADEAGVDKSAVIATFITDGGSRRSRARALQATASTTVHASIYTPDAATATAATSAIAGALDPTAPAVAAFDGIPVLETTVESKPEWSIPLSTYVIPVVLLVCTFLACGCAKCYASRRRQIANLAYDGCCSNGCCSFFSVPAWATWEFLFAVFVLASMALMFQRAAGLRDIVTGLVNVFLEAVTSPQQYAQEFVEAIPETIITTIEERQDLVELLPVAVIVPGVLVFLLLFLSSVCPAMSKCQKSGHEGSYCCTKCFIALANVVMIVAFVFYTTFFSVSIFIKYAPPSVKAPINQVSLQCDIIPAQINQLIADNENALLMLEAQGQNTTSARTQFDEVVALAGLADTGCALILDVFTEFERLFLPSFLCCMSIIFAYIINNALCCAAGCCSKDSSAAYAAKGGGSKAVQMTSVGLVGA